MHNYLDFEKPVADLDSQILELKKIGSGEDSLDVSEDIQRLEKRSEDALLDLFLIEKAAYEIRYEAANRPAWLSLPTRGLAAIIDRLLPDAE